MTTSGQGYVVLQVGLIQRTPAGVRCFDVGDTIELSPSMASELLARGFVELIPAQPTLSAAPQEPVEAAAEPAGRCQDHPRYLGRGEPRPGCQACARLHAEAHAHEHEVLP